MSNTIGFPPADNLLDVIREVNYSKLIKQFVFIAATILGYISGAAVWINNRARHWYHNGGKEQIQTVINRSLIVINNQTGLIDKISEQTVKFNNQIEKLYFWLSDLTETV